MQIRNGRFWMAAVVLCTFAGSLGAQSPIIITDGSVCVSDPGAPLPNDSSSRLERDFELAEVWVETSMPKKECAPATECSGEDCQAFPDSVKKVVVEFRDGSRRSITVNFADGKMLLTLPVRFNQWRSATPDRRQVLRNGKIQRISVDGANISCPANAQCRVTIRPQVAP
jgi:hypothetical protein